MPVYVNDDEQQVCFAIEVRVPFALAAQFAAALTGNDDDVILAAETAMRQRIGARGAVESIELWPDDYPPASVKRELLDAAASIA
jgi:hypothetical protein